MVWALPCSGNPVGTVLHAVQLGIGAVEGDELVMRALLGNAAIGHHGNFIGVFDGGQAVSHHQRGAAVAQIIQRGLDKDFGGVVQRAGGLVQDQDGRVFEAMEMRCFCPPERRTPRSPIWVS